MASRRKMSSRFKQQDGFHWGNAALSAGLVILASILLVLVGALYFAIHETGG